jgi:PAS domain S-box-containing protein
VIEGTKPEDCQEPGRARGACDPRIGTTPPPYERGRPDDTALPGDIALDNQARILLDTIPVLVWQATADGSAEFFNRRWLEYTGLSLDEARGSKWRVAVHPDDQQRLLQTWEAILQAGQPTEAEARLRGADGQYRWFLFRWVSLRDENGRITGWCGTNTDIEDRKRTEDDLYYSKSILDETQRATRCGTMGLNFETREVFWSAEGARIFGFEPQDHPTVDLIWQRIHPDDRWLSERSVERVLRGEPDTDYDVRLVMPDSSIRYVRRTTHPVGNTESPGSSVCAITDVTQARQAEAALQEAQADLARITRVTSLGEMAASIAHEVLQPITAIITTGEGSLRWLQRPKAELDEVREGLHSMIADARRVAEIVERIRSLSKKSKSQRLMFELNQMLEEVIGLVQGELVRQGVSLRLELDSGLPAICGDRVQLQQMAINLVMNGIQAMAGLDRKTRILSLRSKRYGQDQVLVEVEDSGSGIDPEIGDRLFEPFFTTKSEGTGMGLAICRSIIASHGGRLWFTRAEGGTIFHFALPLA